jgi:peptidoglycan/xylan/chitin deacetylase (PgdA/CDA1 family)
MSRDRVLAIGTRAATASMRRLGVGRVRRWLRRLAVKNANTALPVILLYHRVADVASDPWGLAVSPRNFRDHMRILRDDRRCVPLNDLVRQLAEGHRPRGRVCVTFDDGYSDNLVSAKPLFEEFSIPVTFFLTSGYLQGDRDFWWDALEWPFFARARIPSTLKIDLEHTSLTFDFAEDTEYRESAFMMHRLWRAWDPPLSRRHLAYRQLWQVLFEAPSSTRRMVLDVIRHWAPTTSAISSACRPLSSQEVQQLGAGRLVEIGGHSVTHPALPFLSREDQGKEIIENKLRLEQLIDRPLRHFSYPHGVFSPDTVSLVKQAGYESGCTSQARAVDGSTDIFHLPRISVEDWSGEEFARRLERRFTDD